MENTIGIIIYDITGKVLITKPTNGHIWSFPKGLPDEGEDFKSAAIREVLEETSLDLNNIKGIFNTKIFSQIYKKRHKTIYLYEFKSLEPIENNYIIKCESYFELYGKLHPENDEAKWVSLNEAANIIHEAQKEIVLRILN